MIFRQGMAVLLTVLTACGSSPRAMRANPDPDEAELAAARYELRVLSPSAAAEPVEVDEEAFREALARLARRVRASARAQESAWRLFGMEREVEFVAQVEDGRVV